MAHHRLAPGHRPAGRHPVVAPWRRGCGSSAVPTRAGPAHRGAALRLGITLYAISAPLVVLTSAALLLLGARHLSATTFLTRWLLLAAAAQGISYFGSFFVFIQRFVASPRQMATFQVL